MAAGGRGAVTLDRQSAAWFGLERRMAVAGFVPFAVAPGRVWSVAALASARRVRDRARVGAWRLGAATGLAALIVALFGLVGVKEERRALKLAEALRLAEATRTLERSLVRAEKLATIGTLAAGVAHEVGTPLGIISGRAEQLLARAPEGEAGVPFRKGLSSILAQVDKVSSTLRQVLDFSRVRPIEATSVTPTQILETAGALLEHRFRQAKVRLTIVAPPTVPAVWGDPGQLEQVFVNLLINAVDACAPGGQVRASADARPDGTSLEIADDGCGISPQHLPLVLDPFFTTKKRGQGTGLGLSIAADIVKNHGGQLTIESEVGRGTTVRVVLPAAQGAS
jgi:signal transduction histidine kinase